jgi:ATP-dependent protease ClpP protease subunit
MMTAVSRKKTATSVADTKARKSLMDAFALDDLHNHRVDRHTFSIYVGGDPHVEGDDVDGRGTEPGVEHHMADRFDINLNLLSSLNPKRPILVQIASCGGNWDEGMQMFGAIITCPNPVTVMATKWARSMTSIIPLAADKFVIRPPAQYMFHHGQYAYEGNAGEEAQTAFEEVQASRKMMLDLYVARLRSGGKFSRWSNERIKEMLEDKIRRKIDVWLDGDTAVKWGFVDAVYDGNYEALRVKIKNTERRAQMMAVIRKISTSP